MYESLFRVLIVGHPITGPRGARVIYAEQKPGASCPVEQSLLDVTKTAPSEMKSERSPLSAHDLLITPGFPEVFQSTR